MSEDSAQARLHLLIVATNSKGLQTSQRYLERRDVTCSVVKNVKEAVAYITKHKPSYVMLSWNLEGVNPVKIMQVISQSFNVKVVLFAERGDVTTSSQLSASGVPHVLHMPINGPKILIKLQNMIREEQDLKDNPDRDKDKVRHGGTAGTGAADKGSIHLSGNSKSNDTIVMKGSAAAKDGTFDGTASISSTGTRSGNGTTTDDGGTMMSNSLKSAAEGTFMGNMGGTRGSAPNSKAKDDPGSVDHRPGHIPKENQQPARRGKLGERNGLEQGGREEAPEPGLSASLDQSNGGSPSQFGQGSGGSAKSNKERTYGRPGEGQGSSGSPFDDDEEPGRHWNTTPTAPKPDDAGLRSEQKAGVKREAVILPPKDTVLKGSRSGSLLADGVKVVVKEVSRRTTDQAKSLESTRQISVLTVNSPRFQGYLVAAHGPDKKVDEEFTKTLKKRLIEHLSKQGEKMEGGEADFDMEIQKVEFGPWAEEFADFVALSQHNDSEIAIAFVGGENSLAEFQESASEDMMSCGLEDFVVGEAVQCDMFLHLEKNDKYVRYLKQGVAMTQEQKDRLLQKQVKNLHFNKSDLMKYKEYVGKSFIRDRLGESKVFVKRGPGSGKAA